MTAVVTARKTLRARINSFGLRWPVASSSPRGLLWPPASPPSPRGPCAAPSTALGEPCRPIRSHHGYLRPGITRLSGFGAGYGLLYSMARCENRRSSSSASFAIRNHCFARSRYTERMVSSVTSVAIRLHCTTFSRHLSVRLPITLQTNELGPLFP